MHMLAYRLMTNNLFYNLLKNKTFCYPHLNQSLNLL